MDALMKRILLVVSISLYCSEAFTECFANKPAEGLLTCNYNAFTTWVSCKDNLALLSFTEVLSKDIGFKNTSNRDYFLDPSASKMNCQQTSDSTYASVREGFDVGHLTAIDHFDYDKADALQTNVMTNMVPQAWKFNRNGAWRRTETLVECYRDEYNFTTKRQTEHSPEDEDVDANNTTNNDLPSNIHVYSGVIIGHDLNNDFYERSHGLRRTPDYLWKVVYAPQTKQYDAWLMQNSNSSTVATLNHSRKSLRSLISTLANQSGEDEGLYAPVVDKLTEILERDPTHIELNYTGKCHGRRG